MSNVETPLTLLKAEDYIRDNSEEALEFAMDRFDYESDYMDYSWPKQEYIVALYQAMFILFEDQERWAIKNNLTDKTEVLTYLDYIHLDALHELNPDSVNIIH